MAADHDSGDERESAGSRGTRREEEVVVVVMEARRRPAMDSITRQKRSGLMLGSSTVDLF